MKKNFWSGGKEIFLAFYTTRKPAKLLAVCCERPGPTGRLAGALGPQVDQALPSL